MTTSTGISIEDRLAIHDLMARYAWALDTGDVDGFVACFLEDGVAVEEVFEDPDRWEGAAEIRRMAEHYRNAPNFPGRQHHVSQILIEGDGNAASVRSFALVSECHGEPPYLIRFAGWYEDKVVKVAGRWLFKERIIRLWDGSVLANFPGRGAHVPRKRPPELKIAPKQPR